MADTLADTAPPAPAKRRGKRAPLETCLNCGAPVVGRFCPGCGQETHDQSVSLGLLTGELLSEVASFDSKLMRTVVPLLFRPGFLTNEFNAGRRVRYLSPVKMYLVISAVFFLALSQTTQTANLTSKVSMDVAHPSKVTVQFGPTKEDARELPPTMAAYQTRQRALPAARRDTGARRFFITHAIRARQSPASFIEGFVSDLPRMMFVLLPAFALLLKVTYWRTRRFYVEHLIFALHIHAFVFLALTATLLARHSVSEDTLAVGTTLLCAGYLLAAQKRVYGQSWPWTLLAAAWLNINYVLLLGFAFLLTLLAAFVLA